LIDNKKSVKGFWNLMKNMSKYNKFLISHILRSFYCARLKAQPATELFGEDLARMGAKLALQTELCAALA